MPRSTSTWKRVPLALILALAGSCGGGRPTTAGNGWNVVVVVVDTLRADHLGAYGYPRDTTPFLDSLAREGALGEAMVAQSSWTKPAVASLLTSLLPSHHRALEEETTNRLAPTLTTLPELLRSAGRRTACFSENPHIGAATGFDQGFDVHAVSRGFRGEVSWIQEQAGGWLDGLDGHEPFFLYLQILDPHGPYEPPQDLRERFLEGRTTENDLVRRGRVGKLVEDGRLTTPLAPGDVDYLRALYDAELRATDRAIEALVDDLAARGLLDRTVVLVTSDHGEEFLEHGTLKHAYQLYGETVRVPLILRVPGAPPTRITTPVQHIDLAPTLLELLELPVPGWFQGRSFAAALRGGEAPAAMPLVSETTWRSADVRAVRDGDLKLIVDHRADTRELYDLAADPGETVDLAAARPAEVERLASLLEEALRPVPGVRVEGAEGERDAEVEAHLKDLGYLGDD